MSFSNSFSLVRSSFLGFGGEVHWFEKPMKQRGMKWVTSLTVPTSLVIETILVMWMVYTSRWIYGPVVYAIHIQVNQVFLPEVLVLTTHSFLAPYLCVNYVTWKAPNNWWRISQGFCWRWGWMRCCFSFQAQIAWILSVSKLHFLTKDGGVISSTQEGL